MKLPRMGFLLEGRNERSAHGSLVAFAIGLLLLTLACGGGGGGGEATDASHPALQDPNCRAACQKVVNCGLDTMTACAEGCVIASPDVLQGIARSSCDDLRALGFGTSGGGGTISGGSRGGGTISQPGTGCINNGVQDCSAMYRCCHNGHFTSPGEAGLCLDPGICLMPTR